jgi:hypothetical protein
MSDISSYHAWQARGLARALIGRLQKLRHQNSIRFVSGVGRSDAGPLSAILGRMGG